MHGCSTISTTGCTYATAVAACPRAQPNSRAHHSAHHDGNLWIWPGSIYIFHDNTKDGGSHPWVVSLWWHTAVFLSPHFTLSYVKFQLGAFSEQFSPSQPTSPPTYVVAPVYLGNSTSPHSLLKPSKFPIPAPLLQRTKFKIRNADIKLWCLFYLLILLCGVAGGYTSRFNCKIKALSKKSHPFHFTYL